MQNKKHDKFKQYFIAIVPPPPVYDDGMALKNYFKEKYNSKASLNSPPHITLHMPFRWKEDKEYDLVNRLENFKSGIEPFSVQLLNFGAFAPRVIYIDVVKNEPLINLQKEIIRFAKGELNLFNADYKDKPFHPHITLAFRDLKKNMFKEAWFEFMERKFSAEFVVDCFVLLKHNGKIWETFREYKL